MTTPDQTPPRPASPVRLALILATIVAAALATLYVLNRPGDDDPDSADPSARLLPGGTLERPADDDRVAAPPPPLDQPIRLRSLYRPGSTYRKTVRTTLEGRGTSQDWGIEGSVSFALASKQVFDLEIEHNDGSDLVAVIRVVESGYTELHTRDHELQLRLGTRAHRILDTVLLGVALVDGGITVPPGSSRVLESQFNRIMADKDLGPVLREFNLAPSPPTIDAISGIEVRVHYTDGQGITKMELLKASAHRDFGDVEPYVHHDDLVPLFNANPVLDLYLFPEQSRQVGGRWSVDPGLLPMPLPMAWNPRASGRLHLQRMEDEDGRGRIAAGPDRLEIAARPERRTTIAGSFEAEGILTFAHHEDHQLIESIDLSGDADFNRLTGGLVFDRSTTGEMPSARVEYTLELLD